ncbi:TIGR02206 family membrane protein [Clostridium homopropionicum]|uniref:YwaF family protein n=1 Tax=Clostridium homopropionicum TaxID=36844 RepID=UPI003BFA7323
MRALDFINLFWKPVEQKDFTKNFSMPHLISLFIILLIVLAIYSFRETLRKPKYEKFYSHFIGLILIFHQLSIYLWYITNERLNLKESLPLYLCRISVILSIIMLFTKSRKIFDVLYFWGLGGAFIALIFHDTSIFPFPHYIFIQFFISHGGILISVLFMIFVHKYTPDINSLKRMLRWTLVYFIVTIPINYLVDANYCYLRYKPYASPLDFLPNDPIYFVPFIIAGMYSLFLLLYLPFINIYSFKNQT